MACTASDGGRPFVEKLKEMAGDAMAVIAWGACASWGCVQAAKPNPTQAVPIDKVIRDKADHQGARLSADCRGDDRRHQLHPDLRQDARNSTAKAGRRCSIRSAFTTNATVVRISTPASSVESWDDESARKGYCLYKVGCKGPTTYNACSTVRWNGGVLLPHSVGPRLHRLFGRGLLGTRGRSTTGWTTIRQFGIEATADKIGLTAAGVVVAGVAVHTAATAVKRLTSKHDHHRRKRAAVTTGARVRSRPAGLPATGQFSMGIETPNGFKLDNAGRRIVVDPVTRIEGAHARRGKRRRRQHHP